MVDDQRSPEQHHAETKHTLGSRSEATSSVQHILSQFESVKLPFPLIHL